MRKFAALIIFLILAAALASCVGSGDGKSTDQAGLSSTAPDVTLSLSTTAEPQEETRAPEGELAPQLTLDNVKTLTVDPSERHQEIESFGASGAWWAQVIGDSFMREKFATLLFDPVEGIGLNAYRYNIGGGSADPGADSPAIGDVWRRAQSFEKSPGEYDWERDKAAVWFMRRATELGVDEITMFVNSPLERLTISGHTYADKSATKKSNLARENYEPFADYVLDVVEHFKAEGLPIQFVSPINEPLWGWDGVASEPWAQEGCHYENDEVIALLKVFVEKMTEREGLKGVELSAPEGVSWNGDMLELNQLIMKDSVLGKVFNHLDNHSYVTDRAAKTAFRKKFDSTFPDVKLRQSEWCEMGDGANHRDVTMESALVLANTINDDLTVLDCVSWNYWIAVSCYEYKDGLIYTDTNGIELTPAKRLWAMGNFSRYIDRGYTRIGCKLPNTSKTVVSAFQGKNEYGEDETVIVITNLGDTERNIDFAGLDTSAYNRISVNVTDKDHDLEETYYSEFKDGTAITVPAESVVTVVISNRTAG